MVRARKYVVNKHFDGLPKKSDFELVTYELPPLQDGEVLVKAKWLSVDPYFRAYNPYLPVPYDQFGYQVGVIQKSKDPNYPVGTKVVTHKGWTDYSITSENAEKLLNITPLYKLPDLHGLSDSLGIGAVGMPGAAAYFGFLELCHPKAGETVVVTGAAGAIGSLVGQIAKIKSCKVIGFAGSDKKVAWLEKELGFDKAFNYKKVDTATALAEAAPNGVDCFFDNVGGETFCDVVSKMNEFGRVAMCGNISYHDESAKNAKVTDVQHVMLGRQLRVEGFMVSRWGDRWTEAFADISDWIRSGQLKVNEHVTEGFENVFDAFVGMLTGNNCGKAIVKV